MPVRSVLATQICLPRCFYISRYYMVLILLAGDPSKKGELFFSVSFAGFSI